jgi:hypothetical protein
VVFSACYNGDQSCTPPFDPDNLSDACPYGTPGGPKPPTSGNGSACPDIPEAVAADCVIDGKDVNFTDHVYPLFADPKIGNCVDTYCHGGKSYRGGTLKKFEGVQEMLDVLAAYKGVIGGAEKDRTYFNLDPAKARRSWVVCNLRGQAGAVMPLGLPRMSPEQLKTVESWLACGAKATAPAPDILPGLGGSGGDDGSGGGEGGSGEGGSGEGGSP